MLVAVYGTLRKGYGNFQRLLSENKYVGTYETTPIYNLYNLGAFPGMTKEGSTSVTLEVFEVDEKKLEELDSLEGYDIDRSKDANFYEREPIETPFGTAFTYFYYRGTLPANLIKSGDWKEFQDSKKLAGYV